MKRLLAAALVLVVAGCVGTDTAEVRRAVPPDGSVLAFVFDRGGRFAELDARTLAERRAVVVGHPADARARSPRGDRMALGSADRTPRITVVDLRRMQAAETIRLGGPGFVYALAWLDERRLAVLVGHMRPRLLVVDVPARRVVSTHRLGRDIVTHAAADGALAVLVSPRRRIGPARLLVLGRDGTVGTAALGLHAGWGEGRQEVPALAVDPAGRRAVVVAPGRAVEVDLGTLAVSRHELVRPVSLLGRLRNWLEPRAEAKSYPGWVRWAAFVDSRRLAVTGFHNDGRGAEVIGVELVDTRSWQVRTVSRDATGAVASGGAIVALEDTAKGLEVRVLDRAGRERHTLRLPRAAGLVHTAGRYAYFPDTTAMRWQVLDLESGRLVGAGRTSGSAVVLEATYARR